ncbi:MAG: L-threonylcarbamoyladenylate synthase [Rickettsiales bacterium]
MTEIIRDFNDQALTRIVKAINDGGIISFPTETVYALAADASNYEAVKKIYDIKQRSNNKPLPVLVGDIQQAKRICEFDDRARKLALLLFPGSITLVLKKKPRCNLASNLNHSDDNIGVRMPNNLIALKILQAVGRPLVGTSANISNGENSVNADQVFDEFDKKIDFLVDQGAAETGVPSTIVDLTTDEVKILREGLISRKRIEEILCI